nr:uncharacterized protein LOC124049207 isoform X2 [Scatophagus argus]XP_046226498.1 uncharacterized protein LOC124049207 isoform X2 [Scatophagus argus]
MANTIYILNHYTAGVILFGDRAQLCRHSLSKVNFENYKAVVSFVNLNNVHWKFLYINAVNQTVFLVDPAPSSTEEEDSTLAAKRICDYLKMRRTCHGKTEWVDIKWKGGVLTHPVQRDSTSCGVIVTLMARAVIEAFPAMPVMTFGTSRKEMANERERLAQQILKASVFNMADNCAMCSLAKPPGPGPHLTKWIQCDSCERWFHEQCLGMDTEELEKARAETWNCCLCP